MRKIMRRVERVLAIRSAYVLGSFTTKKSRPADVDFILLLATPKANSNAKWSVDSAIVPDNRYGQFVLKDADQRVRQKYGLRKSAMIKLK